MTNSVELYGVLSHGMHFFPYLSFRLCTSVRFYFYHVEFFLFSVLFFAFIYIQRLLFLSLSLPHRLTIELCTLCMLTVSKARKKNCNGHFRNVLVSNNNIFFFSVQRAFGAALTLCGGQQTNAHPETDRKTEKRIKSRKKRDIQKCKSIFKATEKKKRHTTHKLNNGL